jgi:hypothetical protein
MALVDTLTSEVETILKIEWHERSGNVILETDDVTLKNGAVKIEATILYADLAGSYILAKTCPWQTTAKITRAYLDISVRLIRAHNGEIRSFDGDRVMGIFKGNTPNISAVHCARKIDWMVEKVINPKAEAKFKSIKDNDIKIRHSSGELFSIVDAELYLAKVSTDVPERCKKAGIPKETVYQKKTEIALDIIKRLKLTDIRFDYVSADGLYGHDMDFRANLDGLRVLFVAEVHKDLRIFQEAFEIEVPQNREGVKGKTPTKARANKMGQRVDKYIINLKSNYCTKIIIRNGSKGTLVSHVHAKEIYVEEGGKCVKRTPIIRKTKEHKREKISYSLSNGSLEKYSLEVLVGYQAQRYYIEQSFSEAKQNIGMCDYQVRGWLP